MIKGMHAMFYSSEPEALRAFLRDKLGFPYTDTGEGWLIFDVPQADIGVHPAVPDAAINPSGTHTISFYCENIEETVLDLKARGVTFTQPVQDEGFGLVTYFTMPGGVKAQLYQPYYQKNPTDHGSPNLSDRRS